MKAYLKNYSQSPRKVRLVADLIRGKDVEKARSILSFIDKKSAPDIKKLLDSAIANARDQKKDTDNLVVKDIRVDAGISLRRWRPRAFGRATPFRRRKSQVRLELAER
ncbi:50S ribosomal protein L22 [bacterium]|nr:50S ribosomal protein L22 [bacterium]|tara:strand:+ start:28335 stop:28658 length:324 start_codon:yes stop_codon:yes gene_type:complete